MTLEECLNKIKNCPYCRGKLVIENNEEIRCDDCDMILAEKINGKWYIF